MPRTLMLSVFEPTDCKSTVPVPYMPNATALHQGPYLQKQFNITQDFMPIFLGAELPVCTSITSQCEINENVPILLFSPGYAVPRLYYSSIASAIASQGFRVITIDHPGDANAITYPDGKTIFYNGPISPTDEEYNAYTDPRVQDTTFLIDQLSNATAMSQLLPHRGHRAFSTKHIAMLGHSLGGVTAVISASKDSRIRGAINWDGSIFYPLPKDGIHKPVMYVASANSSDPTWAAAWPQLKGPKIWIEVAGTVHEDFCDQLILFKASGLDLSLLGDLWGGIEPERLVSVLTAYTTAWMEGVFKGRFHAPLLNGRENGEYPEVQVKRKEGF